MKGLVTVTCAHGQNIDGNNSQDGTARMRGVRGRRKRIQKHTKDAKDETETDETEETHKKK